MAEGVGAFEREPAPQDGDVEVARRHCDGPDHGGVRARQLHVGHLVPPHRAWPIEHQLSHEVSL